MYRKRGDNEDEKVENDVLVAYTYRDHNKQLVEEDEIEKLQKSVAEQIECICKKKVVAMLHSKINNKYLPHCSHQDIADGIPWQLFHLQGENKIWITGAITSFDLTQSIVHYNRKLMDSVKLMLQPKTVDDRIRKKSSCFLL